MIKNLLNKCKDASSSFLGVDESTKNKVLFTLSELIKDNAEEILEANRLDVILAKESGKNDAFIDRLLLNQNRIEQMIEGLSAIISLSDPVGIVEENYTLPNGLIVNKVRSPLGVIGIIFEARPNVAVDAAALCIKSGNAVVLRGSRDSKLSVKKLSELIRLSLKQNGLDENIVVLLEGDSRDITAEMLKAEQFIDVVIPRGGDSLKKVVLENAKMPVIASAGGNCHIYLSESAKFDIALDVSINAKTQRPATCNSLETLLVDRNFDKNSFVKILGALASKGVEIRGTEEVFDIYPVKKVDDEEFFQEYDALIIKVKMVSGVDEAISHINHFGNHHSEAIITECKEEADKFTKEIDSAAVYVNASTRFTDGFELGLGAEMGISTQKLHARGPIGLKELTSMKYVVIGSGQIRK